MTLSPPLGLYVHWPYCARICPYCDFNVVRDRGGDTARLSDAILADISAQAALTGPRHLVSIFFGGGTPSLMDAQVVTRIIAAARAAWTPAFDLEVTLEANPTDAEARRFAAFADAGVNRLSLGVQSLDDQALKLLGRNHDAAAARRAIGVAGDAFGRLSLDLIYALPGQTSQAWACQLSAAIDLGAEHISPYQLTIEPGTAFDRAVRRGALHPPAGDIGADLYETTQRVLNEAGYEAYEVSNHARGEGARSRHNLIYWRGQDYVGVGPGAHGRLTLDGRRYATTAARAIGAYVEQAGPSLEFLDKYEVAVERVLMGLRTLEGVALIDLEPLNLSPTAFESLSGLVEKRSERLYATASGRLVLDTVVAKLANGV